MAASPADQIHKSIFILCSSSSIATPQPGIEHSTLGKNPTVLNKTPNFTPLCSYTSHKASVKLFYGIPNCSQQVSPEYFYCSMEKAKQGAATSSSKMLHLKYQENLCCSKLTPFSLTKPCPALAVPPTNLTANSLQITILTFSTALFRHKEMELINKWRFKKVSFLLPFSFSLFKFELMANW